MFPKSIDYKLIDPQGKVVMEGSAKIIRKQRKANGNGWTIGYSNRGMLNQQFPTFKNAKEITMNKQTKQNQRTTIECELNLDGGEMIIRMPLSLPPAPSASGKTLVIASTRGNMRTTATYDGKAITLGVNAYIAK